MMEGACNGEDAEALAQACVLSEFTESTETRALISSLPDIHHDTVSREATIEKFVGKNMSLCLIQFNSNLLY